MPKNLQKKKPSRVSVTRYIFKRDNLLATIMVFLLIGLFAKIEQELSILDPKELSTKDFHFTDLSYLLLNHPSDFPSKNLDIVIVNINKLQRAGIIKTADKILNAYNPKVLGLDVLFDSLGNKANQNALLAVLGNTKVVAAFRLDPTNHPYGPHLFFQKTSHPGLVNFTTENQNVIREYEPFFLFGGQTYDAFSTAIARIAWPGAFDTLSRSHAEKSMINYSRNGFIVFSADSILSRKVDKFYLKDKIVLMGYLSGDRADITDMHFTPINAKFIGRELPDMNGVLIHANILRMVLTHDYIHIVPGWLTWVIAFIVCWLHMAFFIAYYIEKHIWFHLAAKVAQLFSAIAFVYLGLFVFFEFNIDLDMTNAVFAIALAVDVLYFYEAGVIWFHKHKGFNTLFHHENHQ
jgi:CHASE2 domain-containing sensor protein